MQCLSVPYEDHRWSHQLLTATSVLEQASRIVEWDRVQVWAVFGVSEARVTRLQCMMLKYGEQWRTEYSVELPCLST